MYRRDLTNRERTVIRDTQSEHRTSGTGGCTGFDGGLEVRGAIRRPWLRIKTELNINADNRYALAA